MKILSGWSNPGGSTTAFINLTNLFNDNGIDCIYYGPHSYHLDKCKSAELKEYNFAKTDRIIYHFLDICKDRPNVAKFVLSLHEKELYPLQQYDYTIFDEIHYVSKEQRLWHGITHPYFICPNVVEPLKNNSKQSLTRVAGVIGSIDANKNVHSSVNRALAVGMEKILIFGLITDQGYFDQYVAPLVDGSRVQYCGYHGDKQAMYDQLTDVFQDSRSETWGYIQLECELAGVHYHGCGVSEKNHSHQMTNLEILNLWTDKLKL